MANGSFIEEGDVEHEGDVAGPPAPGFPESAGSRCAHCGAATEATARYCPSCGKAVGVAPPDVDIAGWVKAAWEMFVRNIGAGIAIPLVLIGPLIALGVFFYASYFIAIFASVGLDSRHVAGPPMAMLGVLGVFAAAFGAFFVFLWAPLQAGVCACMLDGLRTGRLTADRLGDGFRNWWACAWVFWLLHLGMLMCGLFVFVLVGIPAVLALQTLMWLTLLHIVDRRRGGGEALAFAWNTMRGRSWMMLLFTFLMGILMCAGAMAMYLGVLVTVPVAMAAYAAAYDDLTRRRSVREGGSSQ